MNTLAVKLCLNHKPQNFRSITLPCHSPSPYDAQYDHDRSLDYPALKALPFPPTSLPSRPVPILAQRATMGKEHAYRQGHIQKI